MTDELPKVDMTGATCVLCEEAIGENDDRRVAQRWSRRAASEAQ